MGAGEFELIGKIKGLFADIPDGGIEGIGDDCAVIPLPGGDVLVVTTDILVEDVHFLRKAVPPAMLGHKALAVNLSDVAAMGASPVCSLLSVALPEPCRGKWIDGFMQGYKTLSAYYGVPLVGGDTSSGDKIIINVVAIGRAPAANIKRRSGAVVGDIVAVTGPLGESAAGLADVLAERYGTHLARLHHSPEPQVRQGEWLGARGEVHAMIDLSDGLASDLGHVLRLSGVSARIETSAIPAPEGLKRAVTGGEDYQLLLTVAAECFDLLAREFSGRFGTPLYRIGEITPARDIPGEIMWTRDGTPVEDTHWHGFTHF